MKRVTAAVVLCGLLAASSVASKPPTGNGAALEPTSIEASLSASSDEGWSERCGADFLGSRELCLQAAEYDLDQQQTEWAKWSAYSAMGTLLTSIVGLFLVLASLRHARDEQKHEYQAYLTVTPLDAWFSSDIILVEFNVENYGRTPAEILTAYAYIGFQTGSEISESTRTFKSEKQLVNDQIHPGKDRLVKLKAAMPATGKVLRDNIDSLRNCGVIVVGVEFRDVFGGKHEVSETVAYTVVGDENEEFTFSRRT